MAKIRHSVDGRFDVLLDSEDVEIVKLMLNDKKWPDVARELMSQGYSLTDAVALTFEARKD